MGLGTADAQLHVKEFSSRQLQDSTNLTDIFQTQWHRLLTSSTHIIYRCANLGCSKIKILLKFDSIKNRSWGFIQHIKSNVFPRGIEKLTKFECGKTLDKSSGL